MNENPHPEVLCSKKYFSWNFYDSSRRVLRRSSHFFPRPRKCWVMRKIAFTDSLRSLSNILLNLLSANAPIKVPRSYFIKRKKEILKLNKSLVAAFLFWRLLLWRAKPHFYSRLIVPQSSQNLIYFTRFFLFASPSFIISSLSFFVALWHGFFAAAGPLRPFIWFKSRSALYEFEIWFIFVTPVASLRTTMGISRLSG